MPAWPANGVTDWNTKALAYLAVSFNTDGTPKASVFGFSAYTTEDSDTNAMLIDHAYLAATDGFVTFTGDFEPDETAKGYVGAANPADTASNLIQQVEGAGTDFLSIGFAVASGEYFEIAASAGIGNRVIKWKSIGTLSKPVDQD